MRPQTAPVGILAHPAARRRMVQSHHARLSWAGAGYSSRPRCTARSVRVCLSVIAWCSTVRRASCWAPLPPRHALPRACSGGASCAARAPAGQPAAGAVASLAMQADAGHESKRAKRRRRAPSSDLQQWMTTLSATPGGLKLLLDLDNNADAVPQLEAAQVPGMTAALCRRPMSAQTKPRL